MNVMQAPLGDAMLAAKLRRHLEGEVLFGRADRGRYATDASIYQVEPVGVVVPKTTADVAAAIAIAREHGVPVLPRGGGTSQCGQTVNRALVIDCSRHLRRILSIDPAARSATVEPGIVLGQLNAALKPHGLFFPVDPSTHARCTIGGMAGNNSCGSKSIRYGLMADNVRAIDAILADGTRHRFGPTPDNLGAEIPPGIAELIQRLRALGAAEAEEIAARFPDQLRRVGGYNIEALTPAARAAGRDNLARLLVGSEGTLAFSAAIDLALSPIRPRRVIGICQFPSFRAAMQATRHLVTLDPEAVELVDRTMIDLGRGIPIYRATIDRMLKGEPDSLLLVEFHGESDAPLLARLDVLDEMMADLGHPGAVVRATDPGFQAAIAEVREAGLNIMMSMKGDAKPVSFIEDCAVGLGDLADYTERLTAVFDRHGTKGTWYAHASVGCLVREYKGSHSGEHGDGLARSEFNPVMFGPRINAAFETVKDAFDPDGLLNPGRVVRAPRFDDRSLFRYGPDYAASPGFAPVLDWSAWPGPLGGMLGAVEMCNNNGTCRGFDAGSMCPSYRITREEQHVTRGRANTLRLALTGQLGPEAMAGEDVAAALSLCVSCKACRRECPTGVDMAKLKIEVLAARAAKHGIGLRERLVAELPRYASLAADLAPLANLLARTPALRRLAERRIGLAAARPLPRWRRDRFRAAELRGAATGREVFLLADTFNRSFEPDNLRAAVRVLAAAGIRAVAPPSGGRPLCCGRTYLAAGMVDRAREEARRLLAAVAGDRPVIGLEPSCLLTLRDEFPSLLPGRAPEALAGRSFLLSEFLAREGTSLPLAPLPATAHVHGHCHQKSHGAFDAALSVLRGVPDLSVRPITSSCCGMAGAFIADGTSCRHQISDLTGRPAQHSVLLLAGLLK